jgi:cytochrome P450
VDKLLPALREQASALIDAVAANGACAAISDIANPFTFVALLTLCGLPLDDRGKLAAWAEAVNESWKCTLTRDLLGFHRHKPKLFDADALPATDDGREES